MLADRGRPRALCRRAGRRRRRGRPLSRRGRARADRGRVRAAAGRGRSARPRSIPTRPCCTRRSASNVVSDRSFRYGDPERAFAEARARVCGHGPLSAQFLHADRDLWRRSPNTIPARTPTTSWPISGAVQPARGDGAGAEGAGQPPAPAHAARFRRQLRRQAGRVSLHRADGRRRARRRPAGEMDRGPARASRRLGLGHQPRHARSKPRSMPMAACARSPGTRSRTVGAHIRAPEPATLYRMHGNLTGAYDIRNVAVRNRVVLTNKTPTGLKRGFGGPQVYYALERLMQRIAVELGLDPLDVIRRNLIPAGAFPYRTASGAPARFRRLQAAVERAVDGGRLGRAAKRAATRRARRAGSTASASPPWSSPASPTWATSPRC